MKTAIKRGRVSKLWKTGARRSTSESFTTGRESARGPDKSGRVTRRGGQSIRVLVMSDHELTREALCLLLRNQPPLRLVGEARNGPWDLAADHSAPRRPSVTGAGSAKASRAP